LLLKGTIIVLDRDLSFACWLAYFLYQNGHDAFPAVNVQGAVELLKALSFRVDLLIISFPSPDFLSLAASLKESHPIKILVGTAPEADREFSEADQVLRNPTLGAIESTDSWLQTIQGLLAQKSFRSL